MAGQQQANIKIVIEIEGPGFVKSARHQLTFPKMAGLRGGVSPGQTMRRRFRNYRFDRFVWPPVTKHDRVATHPFGICVILEMLCDGGERSRQIEIVAVDKPEDVARRSLDAFVDGVHLTAIFLAYPVSQSIFVSTNDVKCFIGAAAVDNDIFKVWIVLIENGQNRLFQEAALIE